MLKNDDAREEMDAYGGHLRVVIEDKNGDLYPAEVVTSINRNGEVLVVIQSGIEPFDPHAE